MLRMTVKTLGSVFLSKQNQLIILKIIDKHRCTKNASRWLLIKDALENEQAKSQSANQENSLRFHQKYKNPHGRVIQI